MADTPAVPDLGEFKADAWRGAPDGFRVGQTRAGTWWWVPPQRGPVFGCGIQGVRPGPAGGHAVLAQLEGWGFNLLGADADAAFAGRALPHLASLGLCRPEHGAIRTTGVMLPDVFDPRWPEWCAARVAAVGQAKGLAGYVSDVALSWAQPAAAVGVRRPTLLQVCLALEASFAAYHAAWEFVLAPYGRDLAALGRAWEVSLPNKETVRQLTREEQAFTTPGYLRDQARFTREFAQRYHRTAAAAVRQADPGRLFLAAPVTPELPDDIVEAAAAHADVLLATAPLPSVGAPTWMVNHHWSSLAEPAGDPVLDSLSGLERMHRRGRAQLESWMRDPNVIGYSWGTHLGGERLDEAPFGRGLLYADGSVAHEHVEPLAALNVRATSLRAAAAR